MSKSLLFLLATVVFAFVLVLPAPPVLAEDCSQAAKLSEEASELVTSNPAAAEKKLKQAIDICGKSASLNYNLGIVYFQQGRIKEAEDRMEKAIKLNPDYAKALNAMAYIHFTKQGGDKKYATGLAQRAVQLEPGNNQFRNTLELLTANVDVPPRSSMRRPDGIAVVIGNKNYKSSTLPAVRYAAQDAAMMKRYLIESLGYSEDNIILLKDASFIDFVKLFGDASDHRGILYNRVRKDKSDIFIYYSGHGAPDTNTKKAYIVPSDADPSIVRLTAYSLDTFYDNLAKLSKEKRPRSVTVVLDSCFSGGSNDGMIISDASPIFIETSKPVLGMKNAAIFTSAKGNQISSWYPEKNHSLFTFFFLKALKNSIEEGKRLTAGDVEKAVTGPDSVNDFAWRLYNREQEPQVIGDKNIVLFQKQ